MVSDGALDALINEYCREAGVRNLKKHIEKLYRKVALRIVKVGAVMGGGIGGAEGVGAFGGDKRRRC